MTQEKYARENSFDVQEDTIKDDGITLEDMIYLNNSEIKEETIKTIKVPQPIGWLRHEPTLTYINIYKKINWFHRFMLKICFGLIYHLYDAEK
jgi:hypothetical protein